MKCRFDCVWMKKILQIRTQKDCVTNKNKIFMFYCTLKLIFINNSHCVLKALLFWELRKLFSWDSEHSCRGQLPSCLTFMTSSLKYLIIPVMLEKLRQWLFQGHLSKVKSGSKWNMHVQNAWSYLGVVVVGVFRPCSSVCVGIRQLSVRRSAPPSLSGSQQ